MKYNFQSSIIYDTIFYTIIYFCRDAVEELRKLDTNDVNEYYDAYNEFCATRNKIFPDEDLFPFFFFNGKRPCVMTELFSFFKYSCTYEEYRSKIVDKSFFKRYVLTYYFEPLISNEKLQSLLNNEYETTIYCSLLLNSVHHFSADSVHAFSSLLTHFDDLVISLVVYLDETFAAMKRFHKEKNTREIISNFLRNEEQLNIFKKIKLIDRNVTIADQSFGICYIAPYVSLVGSHNRKYTFINGYLRMQHLQILQYTFIKPVQAMRLFGEKYVENILQALQKEDKTASQLSRELYLARSSMSRLLQKLEEELILSSYIKGTARYFHINFDYIKEAKPRIMRYLDELICDNRK